jgi:hypothetical protein
MRHFAGLLFCYDSPVTKPTTGCNSTLACANVLGKWWDATNFKPILKRHVPPGSFRAIDPTFPVSLLPGIQ